VSTTIDRYPSRTADVPGVVERLDPVLHDPRGTEAPGPLGPEALASFERDGFLVLDDVFTDGEMDAAMRELSTICHDDELRRRPETILEPQSEEVRSVFAVHRLSEVFADLAEDPRIADVARQILASDVYVHQSRVNLKRAMYGQEFFWHSDFETWHAEDGMPSPRAVSCSISLTDNHPFNGCLMIMPGSHRTFVSCVGETPEDYHLTSLKEQEIGTPDAESISKLAQRHGIAMMTGEAGGATFFDSNCMHGSGDNITPYPRSNIFLVFNSVENECVAPFSAPRPRPSHIAARDRSPVR
jgi:ectoine hydroxylase